MSADIVQFPERQKQVGKCPICGVAPVIEHLNADGHVATCFCHSCGAGSLPTPLFYGDSEFAAERSAVSNWNDLLARFESAM
jgi:hypothetical protein